eukprot:4127079-Amphidinium_carterae.1
MLKILWKTSNFEKGETRTFWNTIRLRKPMGPELARGRKPETWRLCSVHCHERGANASHHRNVDQTLH